MIQPLHPRNGFDHNGGDERRMPRPRLALITGGAGFVGANLAHRLLATGRCVVILDNLRRPGVEQNIQWLQQEHGSRVALVQADIRDPAAVRQVVQHATEIYHLAAQVAVTTSLVDPVDDFQTNAWGTLNLLEAVRHVWPRPTLLFTSTKKVYGALDDLTLRATPTRYEPADPATRQHGIAERPVSFVSPYGCSKGAADQYVLDYARSFDLPAVVFRMSCIYGPHQFGNEDQGWVAHFLRRAAEHKPITLYGDGRQVRDLLFVEDLVDAMLAAQQHIDVIAGQAFNIGGGPANSVSLLELMDLVGELHGSRPQLTFEDWRVGDQRYYVSDTRRFAQMTGWAPRVDVRQGVARLYEWVKNLDRTQRQGAPAPAASRS
jgi:CDP-paratose 2-epimerase